MKEISEEQAQAIDNLALAVSTWESFAEETSVESLRKAEAATRSFCKRIATDFQLPETDLQMGCILGMYMAISNIEKVRVLKGMRELVTGKSYAND